MNAMILSHIYLAATILLSVYSQMVIKWRIATHFPHLGETECLSEKLRLLLVILLDPFIMSGLAATFASGLCWMMVMSKLEISYAYPFTSLGFVMVLVLSYFLLGEPFGMAKMIGTLLIVAGVVVASQGCAR